MAFAPERPRTFRAEEAVGEGDTPVSSVNVGQFGWTTNDITSVKDIITYVQAALDAATSAKNSAESASASLQRTEEIEIQYRLVVADIDSKYKEIQDLVSQINTSSNEIIAYVNEAKGYSDSSKSYYNQIKELGDIITLYALQAIYKYNDTGEINSGDVTISPAVGTVQRFKLMMPNTKLILNALSDPADTARQITLELVQGTGANKVVWPGNIKWNNGRLPVLSYIKNKMDIVTLLTHDSGKGWYGFYNGGWFDA